VNRVGIDIIPTYDFTRDHATSKGLKNTRLSRYNISPGTLTYRGLYEMALSLARPVTSASMARSAMALGTRYLSTTATTHAPKSHEKPLIETDMSFIRHNPPEPKPRTKGLTEIRAAYYTVMGPNYLRDVLETMGTWVDGLKFAGGSFTLFPEHKLREVIDLAHEHGVYVSTGGILSDLH